MDTMQPRLETCWCVLCVTLKSFRDSVRFWVNLFRFRFWILVTRSLRVYRIILFKPASHGMFR